MPGRIRIVQADCNALNRRVGVKRQPRGAGFGNPGLHHQQIDAARQPQSDDVARPHARLDQPDATCRRARRARIGQLSAAENHRDLIRHAGGGGFEQIGQHFVADQFWLDWPEQNIIACGDFVSCKNRRKYL